MIVVVIQKTKEFIHSQYVYKTSIAVSDIIWSLCFVTVYGFASYGSVTPSYSMDCESFELHNDSADKLNSTVVNVSCHFVHNQTSSNYFVFFGITAILMKVSLVVSLVSLVFAAGDRYFALAFPVKYKTKNTVKMAKKISVVTWILSAFETVFTLVYGFWQNDGCPTFFLQPTACESPQQIFVTILLFVLFSLLWILTILTLKSLVKSYKRSFKLNRSSKKNIEKQMTITLMFMVIAFTLSLSPTLYNHIKFILKKSNAYSFVGSFQTAIYFLSTNSLWNIFIYNVLNKKFRLAFKALFKKV